MLQCWSFEVDKYLKRVDLASGVCYYSRDTNGMGTIWNKRLYLFINTDV